MRTTPSNISDYRHFLAKTLDDRRRQMPAFSIRSYARFLGISAPQLSQVLSGKRPLSVKHALKIADKLALPPAQRRQLLASLNADPLASPEADASPTYRLLRDDRFRLVADWWHFAILSLSEVAASKNDPKWIAERLGLPERTAREAFERLLRLRMIEVDGESFRQTSGPLSTLADAPSAAVRKYHKQNLELAGTRLEDTPVDEREVSAITVAANPAQLPKVKAMLRDFKRNLAEVLKGEGPKTRVYTLAIQLFPVSKE